MRTFYEVFLEELRRQVESGEITEEKAMTWLETTKSLLERGKERKPNSLIVRMPQEH